ncbi:MAG: class I SAM-dependent methyltransferase [Pseudolabrys sp.]
MSESVSPLEAEIRRRIAAAGPMPVAEYMALCLADPEHGYYVTRQPFGPTGDFVTAPEISQMFGELIGLWMAGVWQQAGSPENVRIVELGPGRGTLMKDAMRAAQAAPAFRKAAVLHFVEVSPMLRAQQEQTIAATGMPANWHDTLDEVPAGPLIVIANEFFDALPVCQAVKAGDEWRLRTVAVSEDDKLVFKVAAEPIPQFARTVPQMVRAAGDGAIFEWRADTVAMELGRRIAREPSAALVIDYGHAESAPGDTFQAVGRHGFADPLSEPGAVDLTAHVDFEALMSTVESMGAKAFGPLTQADFLRRLGIETRAQALKSGAAQAKAHDVDVALARLTGHGRTGMGQLFKAVAFAHPKIGTPPGFEP